ncbi:hypothetical protein A2331_06140 [Candidatus Falkowbacteria bacterium RIFOXYB2_FULL_34_18]|uniref:Type 4 fimbrial biogenesis protein PilX N-terminal domain-containing protein n=1 Tax=Candidatus Falkowbacteria bacterium RIFOXYD2_FULL_34_120 TaxID=1798007 RepID=A0A1F5TP31_9BACT|nr:MAG: hypothetical protein A2331_06140 [Candidatus Falkowbacteria bacterium RIFOXYB2_FULL_34_18]OGF28978.1 MAG: hypothetical protein A2500_01785 [Candidatus Falkowbacteria bacterium RIFOXYC12_FULL_34_55]OGF35902.1 MAG: hypothetical protein A2466_02355 [Candidatus Falkowbacteria bacterium RIFOXYC2_FULL_34_220]OGF38499.1 MAG: hypothetical protein A2515_03140 [Candidatus Falkowbacteria bacterium RIFOXYD12_FULL_34_57]OGF40578.1 MAG: hypothetical protein A2531_03545 [Candidatus Falkowbacteria bact
MFSLKSKTRKNSINIFNNNSGVTALLMTVLVLTSILSVTLSVASIVQRGISMNWEQVHSVKALFASEGGMERILYETRKGAILDFNDMSDGDCVNFDVPVPPGTGDVIVVGSHIQGDSDCFSGAGEVDKIVDFSNNANYRIQYGENVGATNVITLTSYGVYENQNRVIKSSYSIFLCGAPTATKPGCMAAGPANSHDNLYYCAAAGDYCFECDYGWKDCNGGNDDCATQLGTDSDCNDCGDVCTWPSVCQGYGMGCS